MAAGIAERVAITPLMATLVVSPNPATGAHTCPGWSWLRHAVAVPEQPSRPARGTTPPGNRALYDRHGCTSPRSKRSSRTGGWTASNRRNPGLDGTAQGRGPGSQLYSRSSSPPSADLLRCRARRLGRPLSAVQAYQAQVRASKALTLPLRARSGRSTTRWSDAMEPRYRAGLLLAAFAGLRLAEVCGLRVEDVDFIRGISHHCPTVTLASLGATQVPVCSFVVSCFNHTWASRRSRCGHLRPRNSQERGLGHLPG
jgi:integrase